MMILLKNIHEIITNNFGLVQNNNISREKNSILFLGDSFTEGQGYSAWINKFFFKKFQIINGGLLGKRYKQFEYLENHISENFKISKVIVFIPWRRFKKIYTKF